jgi:predicted amidohydrolase YtcJ
MAERFAGFDRRATRVFLHGMVHIRPEGQGWRSTSALALAGERVLAVGNDAEIAALAGPGCQVTDLAGACIVPGFIDSHNHLLQTGLNAVLVDLSAARTIADVLEALRRQAAMTTGWVVTSSRWHESQLAEKRFPTRDELDAAVPDRPVLVRRGGHNIVVNSTALALAGVDETTPDPPGGTYVRDATGRLTGHVIGAPAYLRITQLLPETTADERIEAIARACRLYNAAGITAVVEPGLTAPEMQAYEAARRAGRLTVRATLMPRFAPGTSAVELAAEIARLRSWPAVYGYADSDEVPLLRIGPIKIVADGGVETNYLREPYAYTDDPVNPRGKPQVSAQNLRAFCCEAARLGWAVGAHCVGDAAIDMVLDAFAAAAEYADLAAGRWMLIHATLAHPEQLQRAAELGLCLAAQQPLIHALGAGWVKYWGPERAAQASPLALYASSGLVVGGGSDSPVTRYEPLIGIWSSVTRETEHAGVLGPAQAIPAATALAWYTAGSAYLAGSERETGTLEPGKAADLVVLDADPLAVPPEQLPAIRVRETVFAGQTAYEG